MKIQFWGAARTVTGSMHLVECGGKRILLDCGLYQGRRKEAFERNRNFPFDPRGIDAVVVSHAHIDHIGNLPNLVRNGYQRHIWATSGTRALAGVLLLDSARIQELDVEYVNRQRRANGQALFEPLYTSRDATQTIRRFRSVVFGSWFDPVPGIRCRFHVAGHMLGAASVELELREGSQCVRLLFSGDIGRPHVPILPDPEPAEGAQFVLMEATYGDRTHEPGGDALRMLGDLVQQTWDRRGKLLIPAFAVGRTQEIVYRLNILASQGRLPPIHVFVDSPLAYDASAVFRSHVECFNEEMVQRIIDEPDQDPLDFERLHYIRRSEDSKRLNGLAEPAVIISASGMCEAGRILHHLKHHIGDPATTVLFTGFQAPETLGRRLLDGARTVRIFGEEFPVRARIAKLEGTSGHADQGELLDWATAVCRSGTVRQIALVHCEPEPAAVFQQLLASHGLPPAIIPARGEEVVL